MSDNVCTCGGGDKHWRSCPVSNPHDCGSDCRRDHAFEAEAVAVLEAVDRGEIEIDKAQRDACAAQYCNNFTYTLPNGWRVTVFNDCDEWDYLDSIEAPDGRRWDYIPTIDGQETSHEEWGAPPLGEWHPNPDTADARWGISP